MQIIPARLIAACFALTTFAGAIVVGLAAGNEPMRVLGRAMLVMVICWGIGRLFGAMAGRIVEDYLQAYRQAHPLPLEDVLPAPGAVSEGQRETPSASETRRLAA